MRSVLIDSGAWIALQVRTDDLHEHAAAHYERLAAERVRLVTTSSVLDETATRLRYDVGIDDALLFRERMRAAETKERLRVVWIDRKLAAEAWNLLERHRDVSFSFTDATTISVARARRIREIFAFDDDFEAAGLTVGPT